MNKNFTELINKFKKINKIGYIKGINNNLFNSAGLTFENLLNKAPDNTYLPDFRGIEIKVTQRFSGYPITLFSSSFDGPDIYEANYLLKTYGKDDLYIQNRKNLVVSLYINERIKINTNFFFELSVDDIEKKILINVYDNNGNLVEKRAFMDFQTLETKLNIKLHNLAVIYASKKLIDDNLYFRYYKINCYKCKGFTTFIKLIKLKKIKVTLMLRTGKSGKYIGTNKNKNIVFAITKDNLQHLFDEIYCYEN